MSEELTFRFDNKIAILGPIKRDFHFPTRNEIKGNGSCFVFHKWEDYFWKAETSENASLGFNAKKCSKCGKVKDVWSYYKSFTMAAIG